MKKILLPILALFVMAGCSDLDEPTNGVSNKWVQFETQTGSVTENTQFYRIPVLLASNSNPDGVDVAFTVETANAGVTYSPAGGVVTIPAGEFVGYIDVTVPYDEENQIEENYQVTVKLQSSDVKLGLAGQGLNNVQFVLTVTPSACPLVTADFAGTYEADELGYEKYAVTVTAGPGANQITVNNLYDSGGTTTITLDVSDPANPVALFTDGELFYTQSNGQDIFIYNPAETNSTRVSTFDTCTKFMTLYFVAGISGTGYIPGFLTTAGDEYVQQITLTKQP